MNVLIDIVHPAHVHLLRNTYFELCKRGHNVFVTVKDIPVAKQLLTNYGIPYIDMGKKPDSLLKKGLEQLKYNWLIWKLVRKYKISVGIGSSVTLAHVSRISKMQSILLDDDDDAVEPLFVKYAHPYCDVLLTPNVIQRASRKTLYYAGYHELAYLRPNSFTPNASILDEVGVKKGEPYFIMRFNAFKAHHDVGVEGLSIEQKRRLIEILSQKGKVFITTERNIDEEFKPYQLKVAPEKVHSLMYYATMLVGDSQTMTSEAAVLGTPALKCNSFAGRLAVPNELEKYGLCYSYLPNQSELLFDKLEELLREPNLKQLWERKRAKMLSEKIDVTAFFTWFIENYPQSAQIMKENPDYQYNFK